MFDPLFAGPRGGVVRVALPVPIDSLFDYSVSPALAAQARPGVRVLVPFSGRQLTGVIVESLAAGESPCGREHTRPENRHASLRAIERVLDAEPVIASPLLALLSEAARDALCPLGIAIAAALPAGSAPRSVQQVELLARGRAALASGAVAEPARSVLAAVEGGPLALTRLRRRIPESGRMLPALLRDGLVRMSSRATGPSARVARQRRAQLRLSAPLEEVCREDLARAPRQAELLRRLAELGGNASTRELARASGASPEPLRALVRRGLIEIEEREVVRNVLGPPVERDQPLPLTDEQAAALEKIAEAVRAGRAESFLLHGVTGSGKTEVYLRSVAEALAGGRQALVLVPEISLTHQIVARLRARFGDELAVLHSGLRPGERLEQWQRLRAGSTPIAVGARSALFAPLQKLGVIVVDEEHDSAYKNDEGFRYHARVLAERRAERARCPLILGSATPALETRHRAECGELQRLVLAKRIAGRPLPAVEIVDLGRERRNAPRGRRLILSRALRAALHETLAEGAQSILFLNRRGFSTQIFCFECGHAERCPNCDVALVYHATEYCLRCHYCDFEKPPPECCAGCGQPDTALLGTGTERLEEEVRKLLPEARLARLDRDTVSRRDHLERVLEDVRLGEIDVLIGTQMVAKGHDFPGVRLVGVVAADIGLHMPDFRAAERTFQLLTQVAGRAGRASRPGRVVLQTFVPDHYAIAPVRRHDYEHFYRREIAYRRELGYPPFGRLTQVMVSGEDAEHAQRAAEALATEARAVVGGGGAGCEILGPVPAALPRLRGRYRFQLLVKGSDAAAVRAVSEKLAVGARQLERGLQAAVDVSPVNML